MLLKSDAKSPSWDRQCLSQINVLLQKTSDMNSWHEYVIHGILVDLVLWTNIDRPLPRIEKLFQWCKIDLMYFKKIILISMMFQTNKTISCWYSWRLATTIMWEVWEEILEGAKTMLNVLSTTFVLVCFLSLNKSTCQTRKNVFYFTSKALFVLEKIKF